jgi:uncharacterized protein YjiS (DUF1127 family)
MSAYEMNRVAANAGVTGVVSRIVAMLGEWNDARVTRKALSKLSDRELDDIGLNRGDVERMAAGN